MNHTTPTRLAIVIAAVTLFASACGGDDATGTTTSSSAVTATGTAGSGGLYGQPPAPTAAGATGVSIEVADTSLGEVLASEQLTLYVFTPDAGGNPTCVDECAGIWPPLIGTAASVDDGVDPGAVTVVERPDGSAQLAYHGWPLYFYAADRSPGDVTGQGVGGLWYVLGADGSPIES